MSLRARSVPSVLAAALVACGGDSFEPRPHELATGASVRITIPAGTYNAGAQVPLTVRNLGNLEYIWNPCTRSLERHTTQGWVAVDEGERICTLEGWRLQPGKRTEAITGLATSLSAGDYRFRYGFAREADGYNVYDYQVSTPFTVRP